MAPAGHYCVLAQSHSSRSRAVTQLFRAQSVHVGSSKGVAADPPVAAFYFLDQAKGDFAHVLTSIETIALVSLLMISRFCSLENTSLMTRT